VGLNPAFQTTLHFSRFTLHRVNRAFRKSHSVGGKGQNVAIACEQHGHPARVTVLQTLGGLFGSHVARVLDEKEIHHVSVHVRGTTRTCTTALCLATGEMTELIEPAGRVEPENRKTVERIAQALVSQSPQMKCIALCGSLPPGITGSTYSYIATCKPSNVLLFLDAYKDVDCLATGKVDVLKINAEEACVLAGL
jgi:fructose-1-phosphate kinase PfkB-like protein